MSVNNLSITNFERNNLSLEQDNKKIEQQKIIPLLYSKLGWKKEEEDCTLRRAIFSHLVNNETKIPKKLLFNILNQKPSEAIKEEKGNPSHALIEMLLRQNYCLDHKLKELFNLTGEVSKPESELEFLINSTGEFSKLCTRLLNAIDERKKSLENDLKNAKALIQKSHKKKVKQSSNYDNISNIAKKLDFLCNLLNRLPEIFKNLKKIKLNENTANEYKKINLLSKETKLFLNLFTEFFYNNLLKDDYIQQCKTAIDKRGLIKNIEFKDFTNFMQKSTKTDFLANQFSAQELQNTLNEVTQCLVPNEKSTVLGHILFEDLMNVVNQAEEFIPIMTSLYENLSKKGQELESILKNMSTEAADNWLNQLIEEEKHKQIQRKDLATKKQSEAFDRILHSIDHLQLEEETTSDSTSTSDDSSLSSGPLPIYQQKKLIEDNQIQELIESIRVEDKHSLFFQINEFILQNLVEIHSTDQSYQFLVKKCLKEIHAHTAHLSQGCLLLEQSQKEQQGDWLIAIRPLLILDQAAIMEQILNIICLKKGILHSHHSLLDKLHQTGLNAHISKETLSYLTKIDKGVVASRYPFACNAHERAAEVVGAFTHTINKSEASQEARKARQLLKEHYAAVNDILRLVANGKGYNSSLLATFANSLEKSPAQVKTTKPMQGIHKNSWLLTENNKIEQNLKNLATFEKNTRQLDAPTIQSSVLNIKNYLLRFQQSISMLQRNKQEQNIAAWFYRHALLWQFALEESYRIELELNSFYPFYSHNLQTYKEQLDISDETEADIFSLERGVYYSELATSTQKINPVLSLLRTIQKNPSSHSLENLDGNIRNFFEAGNNIMMQRLKKLNELIDHQIKKQD